MPIVLEDPARAVHGEFEEAPIAVRYEEASDTSRLAGGVCGLLLGLFGLSRTMDLMTFSNFAFDVPSRFGHNNGVLVPTIAMGVFSALLLLTAPWFEAIFVGKGYGKPIRLVLAALGLFLMEFAVPAVAANLSGLPSIGYLGTPLQAVLAPASATYWPLAIGAGFLLFNRILPKIATSVS